MMGSSQLDWLVSSQHLLGSASQVLGFRHALPCLVFTWVLEIQLQALHPLSHLPAPKGSLRVFAGERITSVFTKTRKYIPTYLDSNMTRSSN